MLARNFLLAVLGASGAFAQSFEVASIRPHQDRAGRQFAGFMPSGPRLTVSSVSLQGLVTYAYSLQGYQLAGASGWESTDAWDISAKAGGETALTPDQFHLAMRGLLADRFQLRFHRDTKELPVYALVLGKNPPKLKENTDPNARSNMTFHNPSRVVSGVFTKVTLDQLANHLSNQAGRPVLNQTGLTGTYDLTLDWTPGGGNPGEPAANASEIDAVQEQLGLKLESRKAPIETFVIDHAEKPSED